MTLTDDEVCAIDEAARVLGRVGGGTLTVGPAPLGPLFGIECGNAALGVRHGSDGGNMSSGRDASPGEALRRLVSRG